MPPSRLWGGQAGQIPGEVPDGAQSIRGEVNGSSNLAGACYVEGAATCCTTCARWLAQQRIHGPMII